MKFAALTPQTAEAILQRTLPSASVTEVLERSGGELSTIYEVRCADPAQTVIFKIYADQWRWKQAKELHVYQLLTQHGVGPVPVIIDSDDSNGPLGRAVTVMSKLAGQPLSAVSADLDAGSLERAYRRLGEFLATVHRIEQESYGYLTTRILDAEPTNVSYMNRQFAKKLREFGELGGDPALHEAVRDRVAESVEIFARCPAPVLCHNDLHEGNVLVENGAAEWSVTGFIDVENAIAADPLLDLAKTDYYAINGDRAKWDALAEGYGTLPVDWPDRLGIYRLYHALELWDWFASIGRAHPLKGVADDLVQMST